MKHLKILTACFLLLMSSVGFSQNALTPAEPDYNKPKLFADVSSKFAVDINVLETLLDVPVGESVNAFLTKGFILRGTVVSKSDPQDLKVKSVVITSSNRSGATMTFTRTVDENGAVNYLARIISYKNGDAFELTKENNAYVLNKKNLYDLISK